MEPVEKRWKRMLLILVIGAVAAALVGGLANLANLSDAAASATAGAIIAALLVLGIPYAFGWTNPLVPLQERQGVEPDESAIVASQSNGDVTVARFDRVVITGRLEEHVVVSSGPAVSATKRTFARRTLARESLLKPINIGHTLILKSAPRTH